MPLPAAAPLIPPAAGALGAGAAAAAKHLVFHAAPYLDTLTYTTIGAWILRYVWKNKVPAWAKEDIAFQNLLMRRSSPNEEAHIGDKVLSASDKEELELSNVSSILEKLQALVQSVQLDDDHPSMLQQQAALLAYIQLSAQIKRQEQLEKGERKIEEEKKESDEHKKGEDWTSRDSLYENARASIASNDNPTLYSEYYEFAANPHESPIKATLQQALRYATWAYYDDPEILSDRLDNEADCSLLEHSLGSSRPGIVAYYLAVSSISKKQLILGIRGTSTLEDICTDCCGRSVPLDDRPYYYDHDRGSKRNRTSNLLEPSRIEVLAAKANEVIHRVDEHEEVEIISGHERIWVEQDSALSNNSATGGIPSKKTFCIHCHEGIMVSAKRLVDTIQEQVEHWVLQRGYQLVISGHSLGSGVASLAAVLLRSRLPELTYESKANASSGGEKPPPKMRVYCFAPPPVLDRETALAATSYCTSIVCNADMIPRCSIENLLIMLEVIKGIWKELQQQGLAPTGATTTTAFFKKIAKGSEGDMLMTVPALRRLMVASMKKVQLDAESRRLKAENAKQSGIDTNRTSSPFAASTECEPTEGLSTEPSEKGSESETTIDEAHHPGLYIPGVCLVGYEPWSQPAATELDIESCEEEAISKVSWVVSDGTANVLRFLEMDASSRMFMDHTTTSYHSLMDMEYEF